MVSRCKESLPGRRALIPVRPHWRATLWDSISSLPWFDLRLNRGLSDFNVGRTFVVNGTWELPTPKSLSGPTQWALGGWQLGLIFTASDGIPFTATWGTGSDPLGSLSSDDWDVPNRLGGSGCKTLTNPGHPEQLHQDPMFLDADCAKHELLERQLQSQLHRA